MHFQPNRMRTFFAPKNIKHFETSSTEEMVMKLRIPSQLVEIVRQRSFPASHERRGYTTLLRAEFELANALMEPVHDRTCDDAILQY